MSKRDIDCMMHLSVLNNLNGMPWKCKESETVEGFVSGHEWWQCLTGSFIDLQGNQFCEVVGTLSPDLRIAGPTRRHTPALACRRSIHACTDSFVINSIDGFSLPLMIFSKCQAMASFRQTGIRQIVCCRVDLLTHSPFAFYRSQTGPFSQTSRRAWVV